MMPGGTERVPSDIANDLNSCSGEQVHTHTHTHIHNEADVRTHAHNSVETMPRITYVINRAT